jgi:hypothetical protein
MIAIEYYSNGKQLIASYAPEHAEHALAIYAQAVRDGNMNTYIAWNDL